MSADTASTSEPRHDGAKLIPAILPDKSVLPDNFSACPKNRLDSEFRHFVDEDN